MALARRCPQCGEPVTPFAAGCAICGADLEAHRRREAERRRVPSPSISVPSPRGRISDDALAILVCAVLALVMPIAALLVILLLFNNPSRANARTPLLIVAGVAVAMLLIPDLRFGVLSLLYG